MIIGFRVRPPFESFSNLNIFGCRNPNADPVAAPGASVDGPTSPTLRGQMPTRILGAAINSG